LNLTSQGFDPEEARKYAIAGGVVMGALEVAQLGKLPAAAKRAFGRELMNPLAKDGIKQMIAGYLKDVGEQATEEGLQKLTELTLTTLIAYSEGRLDKQMSTQEIVLAALEETAGAVGPSAVMIGGAGALGAGAGKITKYASKPRTIDDVLNSVLKQETVYAAAETAQGVTAGAAGVSKAVEKGRYDLILNALSKSLHGSKFDFSSAEGLTYEQRTQKTELQQQLAAEGVLPDKPLTDEQRLSNLREGVLWTPDQNENVVAVDGGTLK
jgi:hypothetical protein